MQLKDVSPMALFPYIVTSDKPGIAMIIGFQ